MNINKTIHEAMGLCSHKWGNAIMASRGMLYSGPKYRCLRDGCTAGSMNNTENVPDYTDPVHYCALMDWMRGKIWDVKVTGLSIFEQDKYTFVIADWFELTRQSQVDLIAEAIKAGVLK